MSSTDIITINCLLAGTGPSEIFSVHIASSGTNISDLKNKIKEAQHAVFPAINASDLQLFKVSLAPEELNLTLDPRDIEGAEELYSPLDDVSDVFNDLRPKRVHVIVLPPSSGRSLRDVPLMSSTDIITINCLVAGDGPSRIFSVHIASSTNISVLKSKIKEALPLVKDAPSLELFKVSLDPEELKHTSDPFEVESAVRLLQPLAKVSDVFNDLRRKRVHVIVLPPSSASSLSPATSAGDALNSVGIDQYKEIFIDVAAWGADKDHFSDIDISLNAIEEEQGPESSLTFVSEYLAKLDQKARLPPEARKRFDAMDPACRTTYFVATDGSPVTMQETEGRDAKWQEVLHIDSLASMPWQSVWQRSILPLKEPLANAMFFLPFLLTCSDPQYDRNNKVTATLGTSNWPFPLIIRKTLASGRTEIRSYLPRSDFRLSYQNLPRVLVEFDSAPSSTDQWPRDLVRMLLCGASVVRFANGFIDPFKQQKNFVLAAIYIRQFGYVQWHTLYQNRNQTKVCYRTEQFDFNEPIYRIKFALRLYNCYYAFEGETDANTKIAIYNFEVDAHRPKLNSFHTGRGTKRDATDSDEGNSRPRTRPQGDDATGLDELEAHGYNVEPDRIETEDGIFESLQKLPSNLLTVFRPSDPDTMLVAKKIRKQSNELEILRLIHLIQPQSEHIITLFDSFHGQSSSWVILPKIMNNVEDWLWYDLERFSSHFSPVCWGLIEGLAYLHKHHIAHRDIKPENLLVDNKFCLKIIDFDIAVQVRDDDEEVDDHCGTEGWVAPEIEMRSPTYSPIKADRWSCGAVILYIFGRLRRTDTILGAIAKKLKADAPEQRLSLVKCLKWSEPALVVHSKTVMKRERLQSSDEEMLAELEHDDIGRKRSRIDKSYDDSLAVEAGGGIDIQ